MRHILVATDFSTRSDRAIRRAILLARAYGSSVTFVHVIDDDQHERIVKAEREAATTLLSEQIQSVRGVDGVTCDYSIVLGNAFEGIVKAIEAVDCDILVLGPHRRRVLKDVFVGTTAERTIRSSSRPVLMANSTPAGGYRHILVAVDFSDCSADAIRTVLSLGLRRHAIVSVVHTFNAPATGLMLRASMSEDQVKEYLLDEEKRATDELQAFLTDLDFNPDRQIVMRNLVSVASAVSAVAREISADLIVAGTHGRTGIKKHFLGSIAEEILKTSDHDVLLIPRTRSAGDDAVARV